jgi:hypothetical protein
MKKNFADQPTKGGGVLVLSAYDLNSGVIENKGFFLQSPTFQDNCNNCMNTKMNADGFSLDDAFGLIKFGVGTWSDEQQRQSQEDQAQLALQIEEQRRLLAQQQAQADIIKSQNQASIIKSYGLPIAIAGGVIVLGIATYFLLKNR